VTAYRFGLQKTLKLMFRYLELHNPAAKQEAINEFEEVPLFI